MKRVYWWPIILIAAILISDQVTKALIVANVARIQDGGPIIEVFGDFFRIIHTRNLGIAFSIGQGLPDVARRLLFAGLPLLLIAGLFVYYIKTDELTKLQRWAVAGIVGGGLGNLIDRVFRPEGVVDFLDVRFYGLLGMERWPTFNIADAAVVVSGILLIIALFVQGSVEQSRESDASEG